MSIDNTNYTGPDHLRDMAKIGCEETYDEEQIIEKPLDDLYDDFDYSDVLGSGLDQITLNEYGELD